MTDLGSFVEQARAKGLNDEQIRQALKSQGWDAARIEMALVGLEVPTAPSSESAASSPHPVKRPSLSPLQAALHHVLLWFFIGSSTVTIAGVVASFSGINVSSEALASMIAVAVITFIPYAVLFIAYLRQVHKTPDLIPGKVWSIITVCLHSIAAMIAAITVVVTTITGGNQSILTSALLILVLDLIVVTTYCFAAFSSEKTDRVRRTIITLYLPVLGILFGVLFILSALQLGPAKHDEQLRKNLATAVQRINQYATDNNKLPESGTTINLDAAITYTKQSEKTYKVCADFQTGSKGYDDNAFGRMSDRSSARGDAYVSETMFTTTRSGNHCFEFTSSPLQSRSDIDFNSLKPGLTLPTL